MKRKSRIFALVALSILVLLVSLPGCALDNDKEPPSDTTPAGSDDTSDTTIEGYHENGYLLDNLPKDLKFGGAEVTFLIWEDCPMLEFYVDSLNGEVINDAIYERNQIVETRLDVKLNYVATPGDSDNMNMYIQKAEADLLSGASEYDIYAGYSRSAPAMALSGGCEELTALKYLDFNMPWWPDSLLDQCMLNNRLYFCSGDLSTNLLWMMIGTFFNKELVDQLQLENPYDLVRSNQWTLDKFIELTSGKYNDKNGNGAVDDGDFFGFMITNINIDAFFTASGCLAFEKNNNGELILSPTLTSPKIHDLLSRLGDYFATDDVRYQNSVTIRKIFFEERAVFTMDRVFIVCGKDYGSSNNIEFEYGLVPNPKYDQFQENYITNVGHPFTMYAISAGAFDADTCAAVLECLCSESYRRVTPAVYEIAMKVKYASDDVTAEMYEILRNTVSFDLGRFYNDQAASIYQVMRTEVINNTKTFASRFKALSKIMEDGIKKIMEAYTD